MAWFRMLQYFGFICPCFGGTGAWHVAHIHMAHGTDGTYGTYGTYGTWHMAHMTHIHMEIQTHALESTHVYAEDYKSAHCEHFKRRGVLAHEDVNMSMHMHLQRP